MNDSESRTGLLQREKAITASNPPNSEIPWQEMIHLAEAAAQGGLRAVPGKEWALHFPKNGATRTELLQGLLEGRYRAAEVANNLRPDAVIFNYLDIANAGIDVVTAKIQETCAYQKLFDYDRFTKFVEGMRGKDIPLHVIIQTYDSIVRSRTQKRLYDSFGQAGQHKIELAVQDELVNTNQRWTQLTSPERVLATLKQHWLAEDMQIIPSKYRDLSAQLLSPSEKEMFEKMKEAYRKYVQDGDEASYSQLVQQIVKEFPSVQSKPSAGDTSSPEMEQLEKELEQFQDKNGTPGSEKDIDIAPEDSDEYHTPPPVQAGQEKENRSSVLFEVSPPLGGYYAKGRKSYYDIDQKMWSKKKVLSLFKASNLLVGERHTITGRVDNKVIALPLPKTYAIDASSLKVSGASISFFQDQNGCFYVQANSPCTFSVDFLKAYPPSPEFTILDDLLPMYRGSLSAETEQLLRLLQGSNQLKAKQVLSYIFTHHHYPGGGDLSEAGALQYKLRSESNGDNYLQNIDSSHYLECYSANTLFCALIRKVGIPARLVSGHKVEGARNGKSVIDSQTGHAWSEIWDGTQWVRFDATPPAKPEDKKKSDKKNDQNEQQSAPEADDGAADQTSPPQQGSQEGNQQKNDSNGAKNADSQSNQMADAPGNQDMSEASDRDVQSGDEQLQKAKDQLEKQEKKAQEIQQKIADAKDFSDLEKIKKEIAQEKLIEKYEKSLQEKVDAAEDQFKEEMEDALDQITNDGFMDDDKRQELLDRMEEANPADLQRIQQEIERESRPFDRYQALKNEVEPYVNQWSKYFAEHLPKVEEIDIDQDSLTRAGKFNRRAVQRPRHLLFGTVKNPKRFSSSTEPKFIAKIVIDTSGSMRGSKLEAATKLLIFYNELFTKLGKDRGYIRFSIDTFADGIVSIKSFDQEYDSPERYDFGGGQQITIKRRLLEAIQASGGTDMLPALRKAGQDLSQEVRNFPDFASALYLIGDGDDTSGNTARIKSFLAADEETGGFGKHMKSAIMLGSERDRQALAAMFGDEQTRVAGDLETLIEQSMLKFGEDIEDYFMRLK